jgi:hypothetical protein
MTLDRPPDSRRRTSGRCRRSHPTTDAQHDPHRLAVASERRQPASTDQTPPANIARSGTVTASSARRSAAGCAHASCASGTHMLSCCHRGHERSTGSAILNTCSRQSQRNRNVRPDGMTSLTNTTFGPRKSRSVFSAPPGGLHARRPASAIALPARPSPDVTVRSATLPGRCFVWAPCVRLPA